MNKTQTVEMLKSKTMMFAHEYLVFINGQDDQGKKERINAEITDLRTLLESLRLY